MDAARSAIPSHPALWRGDALAAVTLPSIPTGFPRLDAELPGGGWPRGALTEIACEREGAGELSLLLPALAALSQDEHWVALIAPPHLPYAPALARAGVDLARLLLVRAAAPGAALWAAEAALRSGSCAAVLAWLPLADGRALKKLQLAAEAGRAWGVHFLPAAAAPSSSPAALRLRLAPDADGLRLHIVKRRGGPAAAFTLPLKHL